MTLHMASFGNELLAALEELLAEFVDDAGKAKLPRIARRRQRVGPRRERLWSRADACLCTGGRHAERGRGLRQNL
jgi:hypothetical protein